MKPYEGVFILKTEGVEAKEKEILAEVEAEIKKHGGEIASQSKMPAKNIAFEIEKTRQGAFYLVEFTIDTSKIAILNRSFKLNTNILRVMFVAKEQA